MDLFYMCILDILNIKVKKNMLNIKLYWNGNYEDIYM